MFTGIVTDVGTVISAEQRGDLRLKVRTGYDLRTVDLGASISCSGVCLTVVDKGADWFAVDVSAETVSRTAKDMSFLYVLGSLSTARSADSLARDFHNSNRLAEP